MSTDEIDLRQLKTIVSKLLDAAIAENGSAKFKLDHDLYWCMSFEEQFDLSKPPGRCLVGNLGDDWDLTQGIANMARAPTAYQLTEAAPLLAYVGNRLSVQVGGDSAD